MRKFELLCSGEPLVRLAKWERGEADSSCLASLALRNDKGIVTVAHGLRVVDCGAEALFAGLVLHVFEALLLFVELRLHGFDFLLFLLLVFVPLGAVGYAVCAGVVDRAGDGGDFMLERGDRTFLRLNLRLPMFGLGIAVGRGGYRCSGRGTFDWRRVRAHVLVGDGVGVVLVMVLVWAACCFFRRAWRAMSPSDWES